MIDFQKIYHKFSPLFSASNKGMKLEFLWTSHMSSRARMQRGCRVVINLGQAVLFLTSQRADRYKLCVRWSYQKK